jgi:hypothetical protein
MHPGLAPGKIGFADRRFDDFAMCVRKLVRCVGVAPTRQASRARMLLLHHHLFVEKCAPARTCTSILRLRTAACTALTPRELYLELVAEFGIAPNSPRLQRGANLSQLFSHWGKGSLHEVTLLGLSVIGRLLYF